MSDRFGPYLLESELGRGAAGVVYRARHAELDRPVALKVLHSAGPQMAGRFHHEALATARLRHPNIVTVHDAGQLDGVPFLAMELIEGAPLDLGRLPLRTRVEILAKVADAVSHAHANGIVHRDLKPANVLLDAAHEPHLVDFGLAHLVTGATRLTRTGTAIGTPLYMSPEQVRGHKVGPPTDVYSLGVLLYEALSGRTPFSSQSVEQLYPKILSSDPPPLTGVPADLATIALKALEKDPGQRYGSARDFADDLRRWLNDQPIQARPPSVAYRLRKLLRRRRPLVVGTAAALLLAGTVAAYLVPTSVRESRLREARERELATERNAREAVELYLPLERDLDLLRMNFYRPDFRLTEAEFARYDDLISRVRRQMAKSGESAQGWCLIGRSREVIAAWDAADEAYTRAMELDPRHARTLLARGKLALERTLLDAVVTGGNDWKQSTLSSADQALAWVRQGAAWAPDESRMELELAEGYVEVMQNWGGGMGYPAAEKMKKWEGRPFVEQFFLLEYLAGKDKRPTADRWLARMPSSFEAWFWSGCTRAARKDLEGAVKDFSRAIEINPRHAESYNDRAIALHFQGSLERAIADYTTAISIDPRFAIAHANRAVSLDDQGRLDEAVADYAAALALNPRLVSAYMNRGGIHIRQDRPDAAIADFTAAIAINSTHSLAFFCRAAVYRDQGRTEEAIADYTRVLALKPRDTDSLVNRGAALGAQEKFEEASADYTAALAIDPRNAAAYFNRAVAFKAQGRLSEAIADYEKALQTAPADWPHRADARQRLDKLRR